MVRKKKFTQRTFPARYDSLEKIRDFVQQAAEEVKLDKKATYAVELAVDEACTNIIEHGYGGEGRGEIECCCSCMEEEQLEITLRDFGKEFDPARIPEPKVGVPLEQLKPRGVGYFLMNKMMDEVRYKRYKTRGNKMTLVKKKETRAS